MPRLRSDISVQAYAGNECDADGFKIQRGDIDQNTTNRQEQAKSTKILAVQQETKPDLGTRNQGVHKHAVEAVAKNNPPAQKMQEVHTLCVVSKIKPKHAVEAVIKNDPPAQGVQEVPADTQSWDSADTVKSRNKLSVRIKYSPSEEPSKSSELKQNDPELSSRNQGVPKRAVEAVVKNNPPAQETQEVHPLRTDSTIKPKHAVEVVSTETDPPAQGVQEVHVLHSGSTLSGSATKGPAKTGSSNHHSTCKPSAKGSIQDHQTVKDKNPNGGVRVKPGDVPDREVAPKHQDTSNEDIVEGVPTGAKVTPRAEDNPKTLGDNPKIRPSLSGSKTSSETEAFQAIGPAKLRSVGPAKLRSVGQVNNYRKNDTVTPSPSQDEIHDRLDHLSETRPVTSDKFYLPTPNVKTQEGCDGLQGNNQAKESDVGMPTNTMLASRNDTTKAEEYQRGFTF